MNSIAILHHSVPPNVGGIESTIYHHIRLFNQAGYDIQVIASSGDASYFEASFYHQIEFSTIAEIDPSHPTISTLTDALRSGALSQDQHDQFASVRDRIAARLQRLLHRDAICIVHNALTSDSNLPLAAALQQIASAGNNQLVAWCHELANPPQLDFPDEYPWNLTRHALDGIQYITVSAYLQQRLAQKLQISAGEIAVIPPGIEVPVFSKWEHTTARLVERLNLLDSDPLILVPTGVEPRKNLEFALAITAELVKERPRARLVITGAPALIDSPDLDYLGQLQSLRRQMGLENNVYFLHELQESNLPLYLSEAVLSDFYSLADLFLFTSTRQAFGYAVLGAGLARLPMFIADIPPLRETTAGLAHYFDLKEHPATIAKRILETLEADNSYQMNRRVKQHFTWQAIFREKLLPVVRSLENSPDGYE